MHRQTAVACAGPLSCGSRRPCPARKPAGTPRPCPGRMGCSRTRATWRIPRPWVRGCQMEILGSWFRSHPQAVTLVLYGSALSGVPLAPCSAAAAVLCRCRAGAVRVLRCTEEPHLTWQHRHAHAHTHTHTRTLMHARTHARTQASTACRTTRTLR